MDGEMVGQKFSVTDWKAIVYKIVHFQRLALRVNANRNNICENRLTERWKDEEKTDEYQNKEISDNIYV